MLIGFVDIFYTTIYLVLIILLARIIQNRNIANNPAYQYYVIGAVAKAIGAVTLCLIYVFYYKGGDTINYFKSSLSLYKLMWKHFEAFSRLFSGDMSAINFSYFDSSTGFPNYSRDKQAFTVVRYTTPLQLISFQRYIATSIILSFISYQGIWRLYLLFCNLYPALRKQFYYSILIVPSVLFWGSGILKDTFTLMGACWFTYSFYKVFIKNESMFINGIMMIIMGNIVLSLKPYILLALLPGAMLWLMFHRLNNITNIAVRILAGPVIIAVVFAIGAIALYSVQDNLGKYSSVENVLEKAAITQHDLKQEHYQGSSFDIGSFDPTIAGVMSKFPVATIAGLFRPFLWETRNIVMVLAGIENLILLGLTMFLLTRVGPINFVRIVSRNPILFFSLIFSIVFSFSVGLTTSNFGSLVRYKIPAVPFYLSSLLIIYSFYVNPESEFYDPENDDEEGEEEESEEEDTSNNEVENVQ
jgi:hypothetical protein